MWGIANYTVLGTTVTTRGMAGWKLGYWGQKLDKTRIQSKTAIPMKPVAKLLRRFRMDRRCTLTRSDTPAV